MILKIPLGHVQSQLKNLKSRIYRWEKQLSDFTTSCHRSPQVYSMASVNSIHCMAIWRLITWRASPIPKSKQQQATPLHYRFGDWILGMEDPIEQEVILHLEAMGVSLYLEEAIVQRGPCTMYKYKWIQNQWEGLLKIQKLKNMPTPSCFRIQHKNIPSLYK